jgi:hypothetical protein
MHLILLHHLLSIYTPCIIFWALSIFHKGKEICGILNSYWNLLTSYQIVNHSISPSGNDILTLQTCTYKYILDGSTPILRTSCSVNSRPLSYISQNISTYQSAIQLCTQCTHITIQSYCRISPLCWIFSTSWHTQCFKRTEL